MVISYRICYYAEMKSRLILGDCLEQMALLPDRSIDLVFTSPPYNLGLSSGGGIKHAGVHGKWGKALLADGYNDFDDAMALDDYVLWQKQVLTECWRVLADDGAIYYNHKPRVQNSLLWTPLELNPGLPIRQIVIWKRAGGINFSPTFYLPSHEWIIIFAKPGFRLRDKAASGAKDVWDVPQEMHNTHPAPFPVALPRIALETTDAKMILDPFMGSGTTGVACIQMNREFIGIEKDQIYFDQATKRIESARLIEDLFETSPVQPVLAP
jgi:site-specific DNA-methyltransferase (adenine-specific)